MKQKHKTINDYCCACEYDQAVFERLIREQKEQLIKIAEDKYEELFANPGEEDSVALHAFEEVLEKMKRV